MHSQQFKKYTSLQILRALAAWAVVYHHYMQLYFGFAADTKIGYLFSKYGNLGVDIFFVLSGFVMYCASKNSGKSPRAFMIDRIFRIVPIYWFYTLAIVICIYLLPKEFAYTNYNSKSILGSMLFLPHANPSGLGFFPLLTVGWTLNFEMFFYTALALCMAFTRKHFLSLLCFILMLLPLIYPKNEIYSSVASSFMLYEFLAGLALAVFIENRAGSRVPMVSPRGALFIGAAAVTLSTVILVLYGVFQAKLLVALSLVFFAIAAEHFIDRRSAWIKFFARLGDESYSTYLAHILVIGITINITGKNQSFSEQLLTIFSITLGVWVMSRLSYRTIERSKDLDNLRRAITLRTGVYADPILVRAESTTK